MDLLYPNYEDCLVNVVASILSHYHVEHHQSTNATLDILLAKNYKNVVLMLFDGMGMDVLNHHLLEDSFLRRHIKKQITSVFPPTTCAATTTMETAFTPVEHGWLAWSLYIKELQANVELYPNTIKNSNQVQAAKYHVAERYMKRNFIYPLLNASGEVSACCVSPFGDYVVSSLSELEATISKLCVDEHRRYVYSYWPFPDKVMHESGCYSEITKKIVEEINSTVETLCSKLEDTIVILTADHGLIDVRYKYIVDVPALVETLEREPSMESRVCSFVIKPGQEETFVRIYNEEFGEEFLLLSKHEVMDQKLFGKGSEHPRFQESLGDYLAIAINNTCIIYQPCKESRTFAATHSGLTRQEMLVPLIVIEKP